MNKRIKHPLGLILLIFLFLYACVTPGKKEYDVGMQLSSAGKYKEAIAYLNQAIEKEPDNKAYRKSLADLKTTQVNKFVTEGSQALGSQSPVNIGTINRANDKLALAKEIAADHPEVKNLADRIDKEKKALLADVARLYSDTQQLIASGEWIKAYFNLQQIQNRYPNYEDSFQLLAKVTNEGSRTFYNRAKILVDKEDYKGATENLRKALSLRADSKPSRDLLKIAQQRDSKEYFVSQGKKAVASQNWNRAVFTYEKALAYESGNNDLKQLVGLVRTKAGESNIRKSRELMNNGWLLKAFETYELARKSIQDPGAVKLTSLRKDLTLRAAYAAEQFKDQKQYGAAWFWYEKIKSIDPQFNKIFFLTQAMEDQIKQRVQKSIAVFDFTSPSDNKDAGVIVANNLITFLFNNASGDIKILERENLKSILEEMKLGQIGVVSANSAKEMGRVYGIDVAIMGSVLLYKVDTTISHGTKSVRYQVGTKIEDNIEYLNWKAKNPNPDQNELAKAPDAKIVKPEFSERDYKVSSHKKVGFVQLSFRIVDVRTGENIQVRTLESKMTVSDETSAGLPEAKVKFDPLNIPTDTELLQKMSGEVVSELGREALKPLSNLEKASFQAGEILLRRREKLAASESFVDAVFDEKLKQLQGSPMTKKAIEYLDDIFRGHQIKIGG